MQIIIKTREELLSYLPNNSIGVEIGVFKGEFTDKILEIVNPIGLYLVDPWIGTINSGDKDGNNMQAIQGESYFEQFIVPKYKHNPNITIMRNFSSILETFEDNTFDWVYIDGDHSYDGVQFDLSVALAKVKKNGIITGHDYTTHMFPGVVKAVDEFCLHNNFEIQYITEDICPSYLIYNKKAN